MNDVAQELLKLGPLGAILIVMGWYILRQDKIIKELQEKRTSDAKEYAQQMLGMNDKWNGTLNAVANSMEAQRDLMGELREMVRETGRRGGR